MILFLPSALLETEKAAVNSEMSEAEDTQEDEGWYSFIIF